MKTAMMKWTLGLSVAAISIGGIAYAQQNPPARPAFDANGDGVITRAEAEKAASDRFAMLDFNKDGKIDQSDRDARHAQIRSEIFAQLDTNHDGMISKDEFLAAKGPDGMGHGGMGHGGMGHGGPDGPGGPGMPGGDGPPPPPPSGDDMGHPDMGGPGMGGPDAGMGDHGMHGHHGMRGPGGDMMMGKMADTNKDGVITKDEFMAAAMKHFDMMDTNHDGKVTKEERQTARQNMRQKMQAPGQADKPVQK